MDEPLFFLKEDLDGGVKFFEYDPHEYAGPSSDRDTWFINTFFSKSDAIEVADLINALVDDRRGRMVLMKRLVKLL